MFVASHDGREIDAALPKCSVSVKRLLGKKWPALDCVFGRVVDCFAVFVNEGTVWSISLRTVFHGAVHKVLFARCVGVSLMYLTLCIFGFSHISCVLRSVFFYLTEGLSPILILGVFPQVKVIGCVPRFLSDFLLFNDRQYKIPKEGGLPNFISRRLVRRFSVANDGRARFRRQDKGNVGRVPAAIWCLLRIVLLLTVIGRQYIVARRRDGASIYLFFHDDASDAKAVRDHDRTMGLAITTKGIVAVSEAAIRAWVRRFIHDALRVGYFFRGKKKRFLGCRLWAVDYGL